MKYKLSGSLKSYSSVIHNISPEGACFLAKDSIPIGSILKLTFSYEKHFYGGSAKVIWIKQDADNKYKVGVKFINKPKLPENLIGLAEIRRLKTTLKRR
jgi:hypothetical protein